MSKAKQKNNIRVMCRFRPMNEVEQANNSTIIYKLLKANGTLIEHPDKSHHPAPLPFHFDKIFDDETPQIELFEHAALPLIDNIFEGYNATIFAYGQTGAGKTHTMMGDMIRSEQHPRRGIIPRVVGEIWNRIVHASTNVEFELKVSFLEIYNEQIFDLLSTSSHTQRGKKKKKRRQKLLIREYSDQVFVENLNEIYVRDQNEIYDLIKSANRKRISAETKMNRTSSRSHAVLTIILGQEDIRTGNSKKSKFCLVDLAGSEKVGKTQAKGIRLKEATSINKSLTTLGTCMNKLAENVSATTQRHIPFRESVLTRLLSDSLGGNCKTTLIINTSPCSYNVEETISTLRFGERAKKIKTKARINQIKTPQQYRKELQAAQTEIMKLYHIIENCAADICSAFTGTLNVEACKSYKSLLDLKRYTLNIVNGGNKSSNDKVNEGLLANILPDLTHLQSLKKIHAIKKQQKHLFSVKPCLQQVPLPLPLPPPPQITPASTSSTSPKAHYVMLKTEASQKMLRQRTGSLERLDSKRFLQQKKHDPLKKKKDFKVDPNSQHFVAPQFHAHFFDVPDGIEVDQDDGLSLGQMRGILNMAEYNSNVEDSEFSDYNSEFGNLGIMSPAAEMMSDTSTSSVFKYAHDIESDIEPEAQYTDFHEEELPKNFFEMNKEERAAFAKKKRVDPLLVEYRYEIQKEIDWKNWNSDEEEDRNNDDDIEVLHRVDLENKIDFNQQRLLMLCRLIRTKTQEYTSRIDVETNKYKRLANQYRAKNEENNKLMHQNIKLEKLYERAESEKISALKESKRLKREYAENKKKLNKLQKQLDLKLNELNIERQNNINLSSNKASMLRKKIHEKYGEKYARIENEIIKNNSKPINDRFKELAKAFKSQSSKYHDLEQIVESTKHQISQYEELIRQKDDEEEALRVEIENEDIVRKELILQHNLEIKQIRKEIKKSKNKADMWKRRAFVYKNALNSLMEEAQLSDLEDDNEEDEDDVHTKSKQLNLNLNQMSHAKLGPLQSLSPRSMQRSLDEEIEAIENSRNKSRYSSRHKSRQSLACSQNMLSHKTRSRDKVFGKSSYDRYISPTRNDPFHMTPSQKTSLTSVKMKIRGGGGSDEDVYRTPIKSTNSKPIYKKGSLSKHKRQSSHPLNGTKHSSNNRSRSPMPLDALLRGKSREITVSPSMYHMSKPKAAIESSSSDEDEDSLEEDQKLSILRHNGEYTSPAGTFFSKIKHINDDEDDHKTNKIVDNMQEAKPIQCKNKNKKKRVAVCIPGSDEEEYSDISTDEGYQDEIDTPSFDTRYINNYSKLDRNNSGRFSRSSAQNVFD